MDGKQKNRILTGLLILCILVFCISGFLLLRYYLASRAQQSRFEDLASLVEQAAVPTAAPADPAAPTQAVPETLPSPFTQVTHPETGESLEILREYAPVFLQNPQTVGWIRLEGTKINYPVMQTPDQPNFYLHRNFQKEESKHGCIYIQENCDVFSPSDNLIFYGHNMKDGSMFAALHKLEHGDFLREHSVIRFDTLKAHQKYEIFSVFVTTASQGQGVAYHTFVDAEDQAHYDSFVQVCKSMSLVDTGITPQYGEKLITLSTCDYTVPNGRLVVVARQLPQ